MEKIDTSEQHSEDSVRARFEEWLHNKYCDKGTWNDERNCYDEFAVHMAFKGYQAGQRDSANKWISVKDRLPENEVEQVFTLEDNGTVHSCEFPSGWEGMLKHEYITHWMYIPKP
jgi:Protein of unknown function (DUF551)